MEADFGGWATKTGVKCSDGRTILPSAFQHMDKKQVPLLWAHGHNSPDNILGHMELSASEDGVYGYAFFNNTTAGQNAREFVRHGDVKFLSIYANNLVEKGKNVIHGMIREVSLVLAGANPDALIDYVRIAHTDGNIEEMEDEAIIHTGLEIEHIAKTKSSDDELDDNSTEDDDEDVVAHASNSSANDDPTVQEIYDGLSDEEKNVVHYLIGAALESKAAEHSDIKSPPAKAAESTDTGTKASTDDLTHKEGADDMSRNVFDQTDVTKNGGAAAKKNVLSHDDVKGIVADAIKNGSLKEAVEAYALKHGVTSIETLFPDAQSITQTPEFNKRRTEWVPGVLNAVRRSPFSRLKTLTANLTMDEARAKGYIKGNLKKAEWFGVTKRTTAPTTVYKKQELDRDDIVDITDFDVVAWIRAEMRMMLEEEIARAILIGDGRDISSEDKIKDPMAASDGSGIRSILHEHDLYATTVYVQVGADAASTNYLNVVESVLRARRFYKGTGQPTFYGTNQTIVEMLLTKDGMGRRYWNSKQELAAALMVLDVVEVEVMEEETDLFGIIVNLADYNIGADKGGEVNLFDDFDIDYNAFKYLIETRISGALSKLKAALVIMKEASANVLLVPTVPTFVSTTGVVTIPTQTGVVFKNSDTAATLSSGAQTALAAGATLNVIAIPSSGYYFATNGEDEWAFTRDHA